MTTLGTLTTLTTPLLHYSAATRAARLAVLTGEHLLLLGPPGTGKSLFARHIFARLRGERDEIALSKWSDETQLAGPLDVAALRKGKYRFTGGPATRAAWLFIDEIFDASDVLLRCLLGVLNERIFQRGEYRVEVPLRTAIAAANYDRRNEVTEAVYDRFLLRWRTPALSGEERIKLWDGIAFEALPTDNSEKRITLEQLDAAQREAASVTIPADVVAEGADIAGKYSFSPRRERKAAKVLRCAAHLAGRQAVAAEDLTALKFVCADGERNQAEITAEMDDRAKRLGGERQQLAQIAAVGLNGEQGIELAKKCVAILKTLAAISPVSDHVTAARDERAAEISQRHKEVLAELGVV